MDNSTRTLQDNQQVKKNPWCGYVAQALGRNREFNNSRPRSSTQYALLSEEHHEATS